MFPLQMSPLIIYCNTPYQNRASQNVLCKQAIWAVTILALLIAFIHSGKCPETLRLPGLAGAFS